jgi:hypothetical protein
MLWLTGGAPLSATLGERRAMNTDRFNSREDKFSLLDLTARFNFKSASSVSFSLERHSKSLLPTRQIGWIDVHYPCQGHIKLQIRISLPTEYHTAEKLRMIVAAIVTATEVPVDEPYEVLLFAAKEPMGMAQPVNREGITDRI